MTILNPLLLAVGLLGVVSPVLVHLMMRQRRKRKVFSSLRLIEECRRVSKHRRRIRNWPLFLLRVLCIMLLALLFGKPAFSDGVTGDNQKKNTVYIVDASASMHAGRGSQTAWKEAMGVLNSALQRLHKDSHVAVLRTDDHKSDTSVNWLKPKQAQEVASEWGDSIGYGSKTLVTSIRRAVRMLSLKNDGLPQEIHIVGDLQKASLNKINQLKLPENIILTVSKVGKAWQNDYSMTATARGRDSLRRGVYVVQSEQAVKVNVSDRGEEMTAQGGEKISLSYKADEPGWHARTMQLVDQEDDFMADNQVHDAYYSQAEVDVIVLEPELYKKVYERRTFFVSRALAPLAADSGNKVALSEKLTRFNVKTIALSKADFYLKKASAGSILILPDCANISEKTVVALKGFVNNGGGLVVFGGPDMDHDFMNEHFADVLPVQIGEGVAIKGERTLPSITHKHPLWGGLSQENRYKIRRLPLHTRHDLKVNHGAEVIASFYDESPFVVRGTAGQGSCVFVNTTMDRRWTNWQLQSEFFVPSVHQIASKIHAGKGAEERNARTLFSVSELPEQIQLSGVTAGEQVSVDGKEYTVGEHLQIEDVEISQPGVYPVTSSSGETLRIIAVNIAPEEGVAELLKEQEYQAIIEGTRYKQSGQQSTRSIFEGESSGAGLSWKVALLVLLVFLLVEPLYSNRI